MALQLRQNPRRLRPPLSNVPDRRKKKAHVKSVRRSLAWGLLDNYIGIALQLVATVVIARLLTPNEIGIYSVAAVLGAMACNFATLAWRSI